MEKHNIDANQLDNILTEYAEHKKIEKGLGMPLVILGKALIDCIYFFNEDGAIDFGYVDTEMVADVDAEKQLVALVRANGTFYEYKDYGKTWALTEEELK